jgi:uncharacterized protein (TIGR00255 family)
MALQSMTGFARASGEGAGAAITCELRSVNGKGLDVRLRLPPGFDRLEMASRQAFQKRFARGNIQGVLNLVRSGASAQPAINEDFLKDVAKLAKRLEEQFGCAPATADGLLSLRGVLELPETADDPETLAALDGAIASVLEQAMAALETARRQEGAALGEVLAAQIDTIERLTLAAEADGSRDPAAIRERLGNQVKLLLDASPGFDEQRLYAEAALLATKADIREEIDRLKTHVASGRALLAAGGAVGRKLDFLSQEFNRESNTLCAKSNAAAVTAIGLELKAVIDQFREQIQNLE